MKDERDKLNHKRIASMPEDKRREEIRALEEARRECEAEIERILKQLAAQTGRCDLTPTAGGFGV